MQDVGTANRRVVWPALRLTWIRSSAQQTASPRAFTRRAVPFTLFGGWRAASSPSRADTEIPLLQDDTGVDRDVMICVSPTPIETIQREHLEFACNGQRSSDLDSKSSQ